MADSQWIVDDFSAALAQLRNALAVPADFDLIKAGCIQYWMLAISFDQPVKKHSHKALNQLPAARGISGTANVGAGLPAIPRTPPRRAIAGKPAPTGRLNHLTYNWI